MKRCVVIFIYGASAALGICTMYNIYDNFLKDKMDQVCNKIKNKIGIT